MDKNQPKALTEEDMPIKNPNLDQVIQVLLEYKERGESVTYRFIGFKLESDKISKDNIEEIKQEYDKSPIAERPREIGAVNCKKILQYIEPPGGDRRLIKPKFSEIEMIKVMEYYKLRGESVYYVNNGKEYCSDDTPLPLKDGDLEERGETIPSTFEEAIKLMQDFKEKGESVSYKFDGFRLESDKIDNVEEITQRYNSEKAYRQERAAEFEETRKAILKSKGIPEFKEIKKEEKESDELSSKEEIVEEKEQPQKPEVTPKDIAEADKEQNLTQEEVGICKSFINKIRAKLFGKERD